MLEAGKGMHHALYKMWNVIPLEIVIERQWWTKKHAKTQQFSAVHISSVCSRGLDHRLAFSTDLVREIVWKSIARLASSTTVSLYRKQTLRRPVSMETQTGHETALRWILCVDPPAELVHLGFIFFLVYIFLFLFFFHFLPCCSAVGPEPDFSIYVFHSLTLCFSPTDR